MDVIAAAMVSSLGYDTRTSCAAARAGLRRASELPFTVLEGDRSPGLAAGHTAPLAAAGFDGDARLVRLLAGAFRDLLAQLPSPSIAAGRVACYLAMPSAHREYQGIDAAIVSDEARADYLDQLGDPPQVDERARARRLLTTAARLANLPLPGAALDAVRASVSGHAAVPELYALARQEIDAGAVDLAIVCAVDSLVCDRTLTWLYLTHRLKCAESPAGLAPGEAAAVIVLAGSPHRRQAPAVAQARIVHAATRVSQSAQLAGVPADGRAQFELLRELAQAAGGADWLIVDHNGEVYRGADWGCSLVHLRAAGAEAGGAGVWYPAASFGDTGAASGAVATCVAVRAFARAYAPAPYGIIMTSSDGPVRGGCVVARAGA